jgi:TRAP-type C4-dicarboxylate transport system permease small subunit
MAGTEDPPDAVGEARGTSPALVRFTGMIAVGGGLLALASAGLVVASVLGRWLYSAPIDGDFEFVKMATAIAVFAYLPFTQARRSNIVVDTFTMRLPGRTVRRIDAFWDAVYGAFAAFLAIALTQGTLEAIRSGETTMQRQLLVWPSIGIAALLAAMLAVTAFLSARALVSRDHGAGGR